MHRQYFVVDHSCDWQTVETVSENFPQFDAVSALAFVVKAVNSVYARTLMIAAQQKEVFWVFYFVSQQQTDRFQTLLSAVDIVAEEQVVALGRIAAIFEQTQKVVKLSVNVAANFQRCFQLDQNGLRKENVARFVAKPFNVGLLQTH